MSNVIQHINLVASNRELQALVKLLFAVADDNLYKRIIKDHFSGHADYNNRKFLLESGHFIGTDFLSLLHACGDGAGQSMRFASFAVDKLSEWHLIEDSGKLIPNSNIRYSWNKDLVRLFIDLGVIDNVIVGPSLIVQKYANSIPAIVVERGGEQFTGTGFLVSDPNKRDFFGILTAKHNVDNSSGLKFIDFVSQNDVLFKSDSENWLLSPDNDLAFMPLKNKMNAIPIYVMGSPIILSSVISLGYPKIATTDKNYLLAHRGEINAIVNSYFGDRRIIISNSVSPGSSGGPILDDAGFCVGAVVSSFESFHDGGKNIANAAIPSDDILKFMRSLY